MERDKLMDDARSLLKASPLSDDDKELWEQKLSQAAPDMLMAFLDAFADKTLLSSATEILKLKIAALADPTQMPDLVDAERRLVRKTFA